MTAPVTNISKGSLHDGPGVRTVVYLKGCGLSCAWCHNPETIDRKKQLLFVASKCIGCGKCIKICPTHHVVTDGNLVFRREGCEVCGKCAEECPTEALSVCGKDMTAKEVFDEIIKDRHYYEISGGGVTFSGGECLLHSEFTAEVLKKCKQEKIHTAIESALFVRWENIEAVLPFTDLVFADLKLADPEKHKKYTGADNARIVENLLMLSKRFDNVIVRIPVIPGVNDEKDDLEGFARIIAMLGDGVKEIELLKYNNLAGSKYDFVGRRYTEFSKRSQNDDRMRELCGILSEKSGRNCKF